MTFAWGVLDVDRVARPGPLANLAADLGGASTLRLVGLDTWGEEETREGDRGEGDRGDPATVQSRPAECEGCRDRGERNELEQIVAPVAASCKHARCSRETPHDKGHPDG